MKKTFGVLCACLLGLTAVEATIVELKTGRWILDRYRDVAIDEFDYSYAIHSVNPEELTFELGDGSQWKVEPLNYESQSFYYQRYPQLSNISQTALFADWQQGDVLIFHKIVDRDTLLAYNVTRDRLLDVLPQGAPLNPLITISSIVNTNDSTQTYRYSPTTGRSEVYIKNNWRVNIVLSDGSRWEGSIKKPLVNWVAGDAIHVAKDTPWAGPNSHIFMHFKATKSGPYAPASFERVGVWRAG